MGMQHNPLPSEFLCYPLVIFLVLSPGCARLDAPGQEPVHFGRIPVQQGRNQLGAFQYETDKCRGQVGSCLANRLLDLLRRTASACEGWCPPKLLSGRGLVQPLVAEQWWRQHCHPGPATAELPDYTGAGSG